MKIGIPKEIVPNERRVAVVPDVVVALRKLGLDVLVESGAGVGAFFADDDYTKAGATLAADAAQLYGEADIVLKIHRPQENKASGKHEADLMRPGTVLISFLYAATNPDLVKRLAERKITCLSMDAVLRISRLACPCCPSCGPE